jgi:hypothetical protein
MKAKTSQRTAKVLKPLSAKKPPEAADSHADKLSEDTYIRKMPAVMYEDLGGGR